MMNKKAQPDTDGTPIILDAPDIPQAIDDGAQLILHVDDLESGEKIAVQIRHYQANWNPGSGDTIRGYLTDTSADHIVFPSENVVYLDTYNEHDVSWNAYFDPSTIPNGTYNATYLKRNAVDDPAPSWPQPVTIVGSTAGAYRSPVFPDANDGLLRYEQIKEKNGAQVRTRYPLQEGDKVTFFWRAFDRAGRDVPAAAYNSDPPLNVGLTDLKCGYIADRIPLNSFDPPYEVVTAVAYYEVRRESKPQPASPQRSPNTEVGVSWADVTKLQLTVTQGAANTSTKLPHFSPCNYGKVFGSPGDLVTISVSPGGIIPEAENSSAPTTYRTTLDESGLATFSVSSTDERLISIVAAQDKLPGDAPTQNATFAPYLLNGSTAGIEQYNYATNVPCDGTTACYVYFKVLPGLSKRTAIVKIADDESTAEVVGADDPDHPHVRTVALYNDGSGVACIVDTAAETVYVTIAVDGQAGPPVKFPVQFIMFPPAP